MRLKQKQSKMYEVKLLESLGNDLSIVEAARVSYGKQNSVKTDEDNRRLIRYLFRHKHSSPFEMVQLKFFIKVPIFIARQWLRHRTASVNEYSGRYSVIEDSFDRPEEIPESVLDESEKIYLEYKKLIDSGVPKEKARVILPLSTMTSFYWSINLHNLLHFLKLRMAMNSQKEIREPAKEIFSIIKKIVPWTCEAFEDYELNSLTLSAQEIECLRTGKDLSEFTMSAAEIKEFKEKKEKLGIKSD